MNEGAVVINGTVTKWVLGIVASAIVVGYGLLLGKIAEYDARIRGLEQFEARTDANRFTDDDARQLSGELRRYHDARTPPPEVILRLDILDERLDLMDQHPHHQASPPGG